MIGPPSETPQRLSGSTGATSRSVDLFAAQVVVRIFEEGAAVEALRAALGHDVDRAAGEVAIFDVERRELDLGLADRVVGDRGRAARREARVVEAVNVALRMPSTVKVLPRSLPPRQEMRSWPEPPVAASSRSRLTRGSMRMTSRTSRLKVGALSSTSVLKAVPGPTSSWVARTRAAVTTMVADSASVAAGVRLNVSWVAP